MSIDAVIQKVSKVSDGIKLDIVEREKGGPSGQDVMIILNPIAYTPVAGQEIWGGSDSCIIEPSHGIKIRKSYDRVGLTRLKEKTY